jgi:penicillin-binding protein 2
MVRKKIILVLKSPNVDRRLQIVLFFCFSVFAVLLFRLWTIQIYQQDVYIEKAKLNYVRDLPIKCKRGRILDRYGRTLAEDINFYELWIPIKTDGRKRIIDTNIKKSLTLLSKIIDTPYDVLTERYLEGTREKHRKFYQIRIAEGIPFDQYVTLVTRQLEFPKEAMIFPVKVPERFYPYGSAAAHVIGYVRAISPNELKQERYAGYKKDDKIGKAGIEQHYETYLRGKDGSQQVFVDNLEIQRGRPVSTVKPIPGHDVILNLDIELQMAAERILGVSKGSIIISDPRDNSILAMASSPRFDPNTFSRDFTKLVSDPNAPMHHRAIQSVYPPGSVFKIFEAISFLEDLHISPDKTEFCPGSFRPPGVARAWKCWKHAGHGTMNMKDAIKHSCDVYFYKMGLRLTTEGMYNCCQQFGLNERTGIDLGGEVLASFPRQVKYQGDVINLSIGQGDLSLSPIQLNSALCAVANRGTVYTPRVASQILSPTGESAVRIEPKISHFVEAATSSWDIVHQAMFEVVHEWGTGSAIWNIPEEQYRVNKLLRDADVTVYGKTGSAQAGNHLPTHAWFSCFARSGHKELAMTIIVEHVGHGGSIAAPMAREILEYFYSQDPTEDLAFLGPRNG